MWLRTAARSRAMRWKIPLGSVHSRGPRRGGLGLGEAPAASATPRRGPGRPLARGTGLRQDAADSVAARSSSHATPMGSRCPPVMARTGRIGRSAAIAVPPTSWRQDAGSIRAGAGPCGPQGPRRGARPHRWSQARGRPPRRGLPRAIPASAPAARRGEAGRYRADVDEHARGERCGGTAFPGTPGPAESQRSASGAEASAAPAGRGAGARRAQRPAARARGQGGAVHRGQASLPSCDPLAERAHGGQSVTVGVSARSSW